MSRGAPAGATIGGGVNVLEYPAVVDEVRQSHRMSEFSLSLPDPHSIPLEAVDASANFVADARRAGVVAVGNPKPRLTHKQGIALGLTVGGAAIAGGSAFINPMISIVAMGVAGVIFVVADIAFPDR